MNPDDLERAARIRTVSNVDSDETDLLTLAVPPERPVGDALERIEERHADAEYLHADESSRARREVLGRVRHLLHDYDATPENGLVVYAGVLDGESLTYVFDDPPAPVPEWRLDWSNEFDTSPLDAATDPTNTYGMLVVERGGGVLGRLSGGRVELVETIESAVMGKTRAGGQSADRFERDRERQKHEFFQEIADEAERAFPTENNGRSGPEDDGHAIDGLLLGGTTITVDEFRRDDYLDHRLRDRIVGGTFAVEYASEQGLRELARKAQDVVADEESRHTHNALDRFFDGLRDGGEDVVYGPEATREALEYDAVETLLVSDALPVDEVRELRDRVEGEGGECTIVSTDLEDGARFDEAVGGIGAILRFPVE